MNSYVVDRNKKKTLSREELLLLDKHELVETILQLRTYNNQLKNILTKQNEEKSEKRKTLPKKGRPFDFSKYEKRTILLRIAYFGWDYQGLAVQEDVADTIEDHLFAALMKGCLIENRETSSYHRCGRTDKGVSASGQVISIKVRSKLSKEDQNDESNIENELPYCKILNRLLPRDIRAICWLPLPEGEPMYSARFNCRQRTYKYWFPAGDLDVELMKSSCKLFLGSHDFRNVCKMDVANGVTSFIRNVHFIDVISEKNSNGYDMCCLVVSANAFLWHQIRCIVALLLMIGKKWEEPSVITQLLDVENNPRKPQYNMAIELPLNLYHCSYDILKDYDPEIPKVIDNTFQNIEIESENRRWWAVDQENLELVIKEFQNQWTRVTIKASMIRDVIDELQKLSTVERSYEYQSDNLLQGVKSKIHTPLMKRNTCESLENRISHYVKKKRLKAPSTEPETSFE